MDVAPDRRVQAPASAAAPHPGDLPAWLWLGLAPAALPLEAAVRLLDRDGRIYDRFVASESGAVEMLSALVLLPAAWWAARAGWLARARSLPALAALLLGYAGGCIVLAGEELSWGQHLIGWSSPEYFQQHNDQAETNLHNLTWVNKTLPKWLLAVGMLVGGVLAPLVGLARGLAWRPARHWAAWLLPTRVCAPVAAAGVGLFLFTKVLTALDIDTVLTFGMPLKETAELYMALFLALFAASLWRRFADAPPTPAAGWTVGP